MVYLLFVFLTFIISLTVGLMTIPRIVVFSKAKRLFDSLDSRKVHTGSIPRLGGLTFFPATLFSFAFVLGLRYYAGYSIVLDLQGELLVQFLFVISGMLLLYGIGLADDLIGASYKTKLATQVLASSMLVFAGVTIGNFNGFLGVHELPFWIDVPLTVGFSVLIINAFNLIDGVDGLCSGLSLILLTTLGAWFMWAELYVYAMFSFSMVGVLLAFFQYNVLGTRLKIFMGDTGSLTLGLLITYLGLIFINAKDFAPPYIDTGLNMPLFIGLIFLPIFDTFRVFVGRLNRGKSPFYPDKTHIHHKLLRMHRSHLQSTGILLTMQVFYALLNVLMAKLFEWNINIIVVVDIAVGVGINLAMNRYINREGKDLSEIEIASKDPDILTPDSNTNIKSTTPNIHQ